MKNKILYNFCILLFYTTSFYCQTIKVSYRQDFKNASIELYKKYDLILTDSLSIYIEKKSNSINNKKNNEQNFKSYSIDVGKKTNNNIYLNNINNFLFKETFFGKPLKIIEDEFKNNWTFKDSIKYISNFKCRLAKKKFRGRTYYAWYTNDITTNFGPWKLNGLGGLILEVYDKRKEFKIFALNIKYLEDKDKNINELINKISLEFSNSEEVISIDELKHLIREKNKMILNRIKDKLPRGVATPKLSSNCDECNDSLEKY